MNISINRTTIDTGFVTWRNCVSYLAKTLYQSRHRVQDQVIFFFIFPYKDIIVLKEFHTMIRNTLVPNISNFADGTKYIEFRLLPFINKCSKGLYQLLSDQYIFIVEIY